MFRKRKTISLSVTVAVVAALAAAPASAAETQTLTLAHWVGPAHQMTKNQQDWIARIERASSGNLTVKMDTSALAKPGGQYDLVKNGVRDMVWIIPGYSAGRTDLMRAIEVPFGCPRADSCSAALAKWYAKHDLEKREFKDTKLLFPFAAGPVHLHTNKEVKTLEEIKGLKIRVASGSVPVAKALEMSAIAMPANDLLQALQRKTIDGTMIVWGGIPSFKLEDLLSYHLELPGGLNTSAFGFIINPKAFDGLTAANREALMKVSGADGARFFGEEWAKIDDDARAAAEQRGSKVQTLSPAELERWREPLKAIDRQWIELAGKEGLDGKALLDDLKALVKAESM
jgi:TRAP-type C4-dicarboxylate transport system substrate-binding protein